MKRYVIHPLARFCMAIALASNLFVFWGGGILDVSASSYAAASQSVDSEIYDDNNTAWASVEEAASQKAFYVSPTGNNKDGSSWTNAWTGLNQVNWSAIQPGDTIYISGGTSGITYSGGTRISKNGTAGQYITIDAGANSPAPAGHNGPVKFEGGDYCIRATGNYIRVRNLLCQHATSSGFRIEGTGSILENNAVSETYGQGIHVHYCYSCVVRGNRVTTFPNDGPNESRPYQTDGIVVYESSNTLLEGNWIKLTNQYGPAHIDGIQSSTKLGEVYENITIQYNYVENTKAMTSNSQGIYLTQLEGNVKIIGNIVNHPSGNQTVVSYLSNSVGSPVNVFVIGNTIKCAGYRCLLVGDDKPVIMNNLIWQTGTGQLVDLKDGTNCDAGNINNNLYYAPKTSYPFAGPCGRKWSEWNTANHLDADGIFGQNPNLDECFRPNSAANLSIDNGAILADEYSLGLSPSMCGTNGPDSFLPVQLRYRSQSGGAGWDIGAVEYSDEYTIVENPFTLFSDVSDSYWAVSYIERLFNSGITGGCSVSPLLYCPDDPVTRAQMAIFLEKGIHTAAFTPPDVAPTFTDTSGHFAEDWIEALKNDGVTSGCDAGLYCPEDSVTRAQMAVFLLKATHGASYSPPPASGTFSDVPTGHWAAAWIEQLAAEGITSGCATGQYCPETTVTRAQMAVFLVKAFNLP